MERNVKLNRKYVPAYMALKKLDVPVYVRDDMDGRFQISGEESDSYLWCDYYAYNREEWNCGVNPQLDAVLKKFGLFSEWINPGELGVYRM